MGSEHRPVNGNSLSNTSKATLEIVLALCPCCFATTQKQRMTPAETRNRKFATKKVSISFRILSRGF